MTEVDLIQVSFEDLFFRVDPLDVSSDFRLLELTHRGDVETDSLLELVAGQLLGDGASPGSARPEDGVLRGRSSQAQVVQSVMTVEALVLDRHETVRHVGRKVAQLHHRTPFLEELPYQVAVASVDLGGLLGFPDRDLGDGRATTLQANTVPGRFCPAHCRHGDEEQAENDDRVPGTPAVSDSLPYCPRSARLSRAGDRSFCAFEHMT